MVIPRRSWGGLAPDKRQIVEWRFCQFTTFLHAVGLAERLALAEIDYHQAQEMVGAGCSEELLVRILT
jgi:hypothetical protein